MVIGHLDLSENEFSSSSLESEVYGKARQWPWRWAEGRTLGGSVSGRAGRDLQKSKSGCQNWTSRLGEGAWQAPGLAAGGCLAASGWLSGGRSLDLLLLGGGTEVVTDAASFTLASSTGAES